MHKIKKKDTPECQCNHRDQSGEHLVEECSLLTEARKAVERDEMHKWKTCHVCKTEKKKKGPVGPGEKEEEEPDKLETFFCHLYEFHNPTPPAPVFVPAELPARYMINFVPASAVPAVPDVSVSLSAVSVSAVPDTSISLSAVSRTSDISVPYPASSVVPSTDYSVISSVNFVAPPVIVSSTCIEPIT